MSEQDEQLRQLAQMMYPDCEILSVYWVDTIYEEKMLQIEMRAPGTVHMVSIEGVLSND